MTAFYSKIFCNGSPKVAFSFHFQCYSIMLNLLRFTNVCGAKFGLKDLLCVKKMTFRNSGENKLTVTIMILYNDCPISIAYMWSLMLPWSWSSKGYRLVWNSKGGGNWSSEPERLHTGKGRHPTKKNYLKRALPVKLRPPSSPKRARWSFFPAANSEASLHYDALLPVRQATHFLLFRSVSCHSFIS